MNNQLNHVDDSTPISMLTVGQLKSILNAAAARDGTNGMRQKRLVYGLDGICELFHCKESRAQKLKNTIIKEAVSQDGRTIVVDADFAIELFEKNSKKTK
ncbi:MAG: DUF3853 family protein [Bacteroidales bacterium]|nr:DUF3853 family protein [Bacteroidales bacterium]